MNNNEKPSYDLNVILIRIGLLEKDLLNTKKQLYELRKSFDNHLLEGSIRMGDLP